MRVFRSVVTSILLILLLSACSRFWLATGTTESNFSLAANGVTVVCPDAAVGDSGLVGEVTYTKRDGAGVRELIAAGDGADGWDLLPTTCTTGVSDFSKMFEEVGAFNEDISSWDTSSATNMHRMFRNAVQFNQDIGDWDTSNVTNMSYQFAGAVVFDQDIGGWDTGSVTTTAEMFTGAFEFNQDLGDWNTSNIANMNAMFIFAIKFNQDLSGWCVSLIGELPVNFLIQTAMADDTAKHPQWGTCPSE